MLGKWADGARLYLALLIGLLASACLFGQSAQNAKPQNAAAVSLQPPLPPMPLPPVDFRQLLAMNAAEREKVFATRTEPQRQTLLEKLHEYESLPPVEREARLCSLELRLYLLPLLQIPPSNRLERVEAVPQPDRKLVEERLQFWDRLPAEVQKEFLTNQLVLRYVFRPEPAPPTQGPKVPAHLHDKIEQGIEGWNRLPEAKRQEILENFRRLFELSDKEKAKVLDEFSDAERQRMQASLRTFEQLPKAQRERCVSGFQKFARLSPQERQQFLNNVEVWQRMSAADRRAWQSIVNRISMPEPPPPPPPMPRLPPPSPTSISTASTNNP
jgi:hypothetical protein